MGIATRLHFEIRGAAGEFCAFHRRQAIAFPLWRHCDMSRCALTRCSAGLGVIETADVITSHGDRCASRCRFLRAMIIAQTKSPARRPGFSKSYSACRLLSELRDLVRQARDL
ncbi:hypothetical protein, partial [Tardiphaga sp.]|uniref:hypothetical protein n=1 Tax=Tardiphaga sp. TaxID=1926292 RepID=UPI0037DA74E2